MNKTLTLVLAICLTLSSAAMAEIKILKRWAGVSNGRGSAALYLQIQNTSNKPDKLISAQIAEATHTEFHNHIDQGNGILHMGIVDSIPVPQNGIMQFKPGGYHIMMQGLRPLKAGQDSVHATLGFASGQTVQVIAPVQAGGEE